ncbi:MAG TPA: NAD-dependent deacylase [Limnochordales bacterium]
MERAVPFPPDGLVELVEGLRASRQVVVLTGAGVSTESGLPDFRSPGGLWSQEDPARLASVEALEREPLRFYRFYQTRLRMLAGARPNPAHYALARLQRAGRIGLIATQNVDGLHQKAGAVDVAELHGSLAWARCHRCHRRFEASVLDRPIVTEQDIPRCHACGGMVRPAVVLFGELLPELAYRRAMLAAQSCDAMLVVGSSLEVYPAAGLPEVAMACGARLFLVNLGETPYDDRADVVVRARAGVVLPELARALGIELAADDAAHT